MRPLETVYHRTAQLDWTEVITCPHCHARWKGGVIARGHGSDRTFHGMGDQAAYEGAGSDAFAAAVDAGRAMLLRARCPRCHKRGGGIGSLVIKSAFLHGVLVGLATWGARSLARGGAWPGGSDPRLLPILIVLAVVLLPLTIISSLRSVDRRVRFEPLQEIGSQPAPPPPPAPERHAPASPGSLELDVDHSWNKKR
jgi:hypothetical protein